MPAATRSSASPPGALSQSGLFASAAERRSFYYFQTHASKPLAGYFNASFWGREIMQAAIHYEPVRHLVIALGAAYESFEGPDTPGKSSPGLLESHEDKTKTDGVEFALLQCNQSIRQLATMSTKETSGYKSAEATCCVLTASILFIYLALIRSNIAEAIQHVQSAVKVLRDFERQSQSKSHTPGRSPSTRSRSTSPIFPVPISQLRSVLISIYGQLRAMSDDVIIGEIETGVEDMLLSDIKPATVFLSVPEAHSYVERLFHNTLAFLQQTAYNPPPKTDTAGLEAVVARHKDLCRALDSSWTALDTLSSSLMSSPGSDDDQQSQLDKDKDGTAVLRLYHLLLAVRLRIDIFRPDKRESAFDELESHLAEMLGLCEILAANENRQSRPAVVSSGLGYVMPLHMIAARCRNSKLRRRALQLLLEGGRRDGIWDGRLAGKIASETLKIEEQRGDDEGGRVRDIKIKLQGGRKALLRFVTVADWKGGSKGTEKVISW